MMVSELSILIDAVITVCFIQAFVCINCYMNRVHLQRVVESFCTRLCLTGMGFLIFVLVLVDLEYNLPELVDVCATFMGKSPVVGAESETLHVKI